MTGGLDCIVKAVTQLEEKLRTDKNGKKVASSTAPTASSSGEARLVSAEQPPQVSAFIALSKQRGAQDIAALTQRGAMGMEETEVALNARVKQIILHDLALYELKTIPVPGPNEAIPCVTHMDVLSGRGGETNHHPGNILYRQFVRACQPEYIEAKRREKPYIAQRIVLAVRKMGGRFLKKDHSNIWRDVGNTKAREKTSQA